MSVLDMPVSDGFSQVLETMADVAAALRNPGSKLEELAAASKKARELTKEANAASKAADDKKAELEQWMKTEKAQHDDLLLRGRQAHEKEVVAFERMRGALIDEAKKLRDQARADADMAATKLKELNHKLTVISQTAAA